LKQNYRKKGEKIFIHGNCGKQPVSTISAETKSKIVKLKQSDIYEEANFKHFTEMIQEDENINVSYSSVCRILDEKSIKSPRKHKKQVIHRRRERLPQKGQMLQMDGTPFQFFKGDNELYSLHGFIDDATGIVTGLYMCKNECLQGYLEVLRQTLRKYGAPQSIYTDGTNIMFNNLKKEVSIEDQLKGIEEYSTRFGEI
jgi:transposase